jgi:predicted polyphosphate/ATP-dependent NAD kinase
MYCANSARREVADRLPQRISLPLNPEQALMLNVLYLIGESIMRRDSAAVTKLVRGIAKMVYSKPGETTRDELRALMEKHIDVVQDAGGWYDGTATDWLAELKAAVFEVPPEWTPTRDATGDPEC